MKTAAFLTLTLLATTVVPAAHASSSQGSGSGRGRSARECCEAAVWLAQEDGMHRCDEDAGHVRVRPGTMRGLCKLEPAANEIRCSATSKVTCR
jgi:hypothetical protein